MTERHQFSALLLIALAAVAVPASAQESTEGAEKRTRIILGPQLSPSWPGADKFSVGPYIDVSRTRESTFEFEAPDESFGQPLVHSGDYVAREGDDWLFSIGPRVTLGDAKYHRAYFGVTPEAATTSGLPAYDPGGGVQSVGVTAGYHRMLGRNWGVAVYGRYDRLVGDAADSPVTRQLGSRSQPSAGVALSYTF